MAISEGDEGFPTEADERVLRMYNLQVEIERGKAATERLREEIRAENRKFAVQTSLAFIAAVTSGLAFGVFATPNFVSPSQPPVIIIQVPLGSTVVAAPPVGK